MVANTVNKYLPARLLVTRKGFLALQMALTSLWSLIPLSFTMQYCLKALICSLSALTFHGKFPMDCNGCNFRNEVSQSVSGVPPYQQYLLSSCNEPRSWVQILAWPRLISQRCFVTVLRPCAGLSGWCTNPQSLPNHALLPCNSGLEMRTFTQKLFVKTGLL